MGGYKAYFRTDIINKLEENKIKAYIPVSACSYRIDEELYKYNKDSDQWFCKNGNETNILKTRKTKTGKIVLRYFLKKEICKNYYLKISI